MNGLSLLYWPGLNLAVNLLGKLSGPRPREAAGYLWLLSGHDRNVNQAMILCVTGYVSA